MPGASGVVVVGVYDHITEINSRLVCVRYTGLELLKVAVEKAGYTGKIQIGMDVAASEFCKDKLYDLDFKNPKSNKADWVRRRHRWLSGSSQFRLEGMQAVGRARL